MKKLSYLFAVLIMAAALFSCEQDNSDMITLKKGDAVTAVSAASGVVPVIIPGANNGGNRTCDEVAAAFGLPEGYFLCGERIDYSEGTFNGEFPDGVNVVVTGGKYVSFKLDAPIVIGDVKYVVGAVIVKGGNAANVYYYPGGIMEDSNLYSPVNASGKPAGLSNLTICLMKQLPDLVIAMKTYLATPIEGKEGEYNSKISWAVSGGLGVSTEYGLHMGYNHYVYGMENKFDLVRASLSAVIGKIGTIAVNDYWEEGVHYLEVKVTIEESGWMFDDSYLYAGSLGGYAGRYYTNFPYKVINEIAPERLFKIDFSQITL